MSSEMEIYHVPIVDYKMASSGRKKDLERIVQDLILEGWQPYGGLLAVNHNKGGDGEKYGIWFYQAMVRYADV